MDVLMHVSHDFLLLPLASLGALFLVTTILTNIKNRRRGIKINWVMHINACWHSWIKPLNTFDEETCVLIQKDFRFFKDVVKKILRGDISGLIKMFNDK